MGRDTAVKPRLFLDIDGVLNDHRPHPNGYCGIKASCAEQLNRVILATDCDLIIHSAWRYLILGGQMTVDGFAAMLATHGVEVYHDLHGRAKHRVVGHTRADEKDGSTSDRVVQILGMAGSGHWAAVDDLDLQLPQSRFVRTDGHVGLTEENADRLIVCLTSYSP